MQPEASFRPGVSKPRIWDWETPFACVNGTYCSSEADQPGRDALSCCIYVQHSRRVYSRTPGIDGLPWAISLETEWHLTGTVRAVWKGFRHAADASLVTAPLSRGTIPLDNWGLCRSTAQFQSHSVCTWDVLGKVYPFFCCGLPHCSCRTQKPKCHFPSHVNVVFQLLKLTCHLPAILSSVSVIPIDQVN